MKDEKLSRDVALFRYSIIAEFIHHAPGTPGLYQKLAQKAAGEYNIPGSNRTRVAMETIRDWLRMYRTGGFDALLPRPRKDTGQPRAIPDALTETLLAVKEENRLFSVRQVIKEATARGVVPQDLYLAPSSVHRLLSCHGLMQKPTDAPTDNDRRHFEFQKAGDLYMSDVMNGPPVGAEGNRKFKAYLIAFLDDATRVIPFAAFAHSENSEAFMGVFKQALLRRGIPKRLFVDYVTGYIIDIMCLVALCGGLSAAVDELRDGPAKPAT